jgi:hypothetical protein
MDVEFQLTPEDLPAFARYHQQLLPEKNQAVPQWFWGVLLVLFVGFMICAYRWGIRQSEFVGFLMGGFVAVLWIMFLLLWRYKAALQRQKRLQADERNHYQYQYEVKRLTLSPEGITVTGSQSISTNRWPMIWHVGNTSDYAFFYVSLESAIVVPRRAFRDEQHFEEFIALARQYQQEAAQPEPKPSGIIAGLPPESTAISRPPQS